MNEQPLVMVTSPDGVPLALWASGSGRPLLLIHGTTSDHSTFDELVPHLEPHRKVYRYDRRGRGLSGDGAEDETYGIELEYDDAVAIIDQIVELEGVPVDIVSHSFGAYVALGAVSRSNSVNGLVAYSPGFGAEYPEGALKSIDEAISSSDPDTALSLVFKEIIGMPEKDIQVLKDTDVWQVRVDAAWSVVRECEADEAFLRTSGAMLASIAQPVMVLSGEKNVPAKRKIADTLASQIPGSVLEELAGEGHAAHHTAPGALASSSLDYFDSLVA